MIGGGGSPGGTSAGLMLPPNQGAAAQGYQDLTQSLYQQGMNALNQMGGVSPAQYAYPYVTGATSAILSNPYQDLARQGGATEQNIFQNQMMPQGMAAAGQLDYLGNLAAGQAGAIPGMVNNPAYGQAGQYGQQFAPQLMQAGQSLLQTGFDPQQALYNRTAQQIRDQQNAINSQSGVASSPYGAGLSGQRMQDFNIDWQNQQLARQAQAGPAAANLFGAAQQGLMAGPNAQLAAAGSGANTIDALIRGAGQGLTGAQGMYGGLGQAAPTMMGAPYNVGNQIQGNNFGALQNMLNLGNQQYGPAQAAASNLSTYMGLGQSASNLANQIGQTNFNQASQLGGGLMQGLGALGNLGGPNSIFSGTNLLGGSGPLFGASGLFGSGAGAGFGLDALGSAAASGPELFAAVEAAPELAALGFI